MKKVSIIVPCYNEQESLPYFWQEISNVANELYRYTFEFIFVDDGSRDETLSVLRKMATENGNGRRADSVCVFFPEFWQRSSYVRRP